MSSIKYPEKKFLLNYDLSFDFFEEIGINVLDITPLRKVFLLKTDNSKLILKYIDYDEEKLKFVITCIEELSKKYKNIVSLIKFKNGKYYVKWKNKKYIVMKLIEGREATFTNILELKKCTEELAKMHLASKEILPMIKEKFNKDINSIKNLSLKERFRLSLNNMEFLRYSVSKFKYKNEFDELFLGGAEDYIKDIKYAKDLLNTEKYDIYENNTNNISICHNDLASHNFLINDEKVCIIDFEYVTIDFSIIDLGDILLKGIKNAAFDFEKCIEIINSYCAIIPLSKMDYRLLYIIILYPRDICSIVRSYYLKEKEWEYEVFLDRFRDKVENEIFRREFLIEYKKKFL